MPALPEIRHGIARSILSKTTGFIAEAGFTHSLTPARNCTFGCTYCYVPAMRFQGGLQPEDWQRWGQFTTFKSNAAERLAKELRRDQRIYCSPVVDPYQPAEAEEQLMPRVLDALISAPPRVLALQTRGPLVLRDLTLLGALTERTTVRVSFSLTTNREDIRRLYEPHCPPVCERLDVMRALREAGIEVYATLAPLLPCDPEELARLAIDATGRDLIGDPLHVRSVKRRGATTRDAALKISMVNGHGEWFNPEFQDRIVERIRNVAITAGYTFHTGPLGFSKLAT